MALDGYPASLPLELLEAVAEDLETDDDISSLSRACRSLHGKLSSYLYRRNARRAAENAEWSVLRWAARYGRVETVHAALRVGVTAHHDPGLLAYTIDKGDMPTIEAVLDMDGVDIDAFAEGDFLLEPAPVYSGSAWMSMDVGPYTPLYIAVRKGDIRTAELLLARGADPEKPGPMSADPLRLAVLVRRADMVRLLLGAGAHADCARPDGRTLLDEAVTGGGGEVVSVLLENGADPAGAGAQRPVHGAAAFGDVEALELLVDHGADIAIPDEHGWTPLQLAVLNGKEEAARFLLGRGARMSTPEGRKALLNQACRLKRGGMLDVLLENEVEVPEGDEAYRLMWFAARRGGYGSIKALLDNGAHPEGIEDPAGRVTPLMIAAAKNHTSIVQLLIDAGADVRRADSAGTTPLHCAASRGRTRIVKFLLEKGADPTAVDCCGRSPLFHAAMRGREKVVSLLLRQRGSAAAGLTTDMYRTTPLMAATRNLHRGAMEVLLAAEPASVHKADAHGRSIAWWAGKSPNSWFVALVAHYASGKDGPPHSAPSPVPRRAPRERYGGKCRCDVCTRVTVYAQFTPAHRCTMCRRGMFLMCGECAAEGEWCCDRGHDLVVQGRNQEEDSDEEESLWGRPFGFEMRFLETEDSSSGEMSGDESEGA